MTACARKYQINETQSELVRAELTKFIGELSTDQFRNETNKPEPMSSEERS